MYTYYVTYPRHFFDWLSCTPLKLPYFSCTHQLTVKYWGDAQAWISAQPLVSQSSEFPEKNWASAHPRIKALLYREAKCAEFRAPVLLQPIPIAAILHSSMYGTFFHPLNEWKPFETGYIAGFMMLMHMITCVLPISRNISFYSCSSDPARFESPLADVLGSSALLLLHIYLEPFYHDLVHALNDAGIIRHNHSWWHAHLMTCSTHLLRCIPIMLYAANSKWTYDSTHGCTESWRCHSSLICPD